MTDEELREKNRQMIENIRDGLGDFFENLRDKCETISFNFDESKPKLMHVQINPDGSIGDVKYEY